MCILWPVRFFVTLWFATGSISWNLISEEFYSIWILWIHVGDLQFFLRIPFVFGHVRKRLVGGQKENRRLFSQVQFLLPNNGNSGNLMMSTEKSWVWIPKILGQSDRGLGALGTDLLVGWVDLWRRKTKKEKETHLQCAAQASRPSPAWRPSPSWSWSWFRSWPWSWSCRLLTEGAHGGSRRTGGTSGRLPED